MSWQTYVDEHLMCDIEGNVLTSAAIIGHDGTVWAQSTSFPQVRLTHLLFRFISFYNSLGLLLVLILNRRDIFIEIDLMGFEDKKNLQVRNAASLTWMVPVCSFGLKRKNLGWLANLFLNGVTYDSLDYALLFVVQGGNFLNPTFRRKAKDLDIELLADLFGKRFCVVLMMASSMESHLENQGSCKVVFDLEGGSTLSGGDHWRRKLVTGASCAKRRRILKTLVPLGVEMF
ncbi:hypothetical protein RJ640_006355 [Escallonia rubra]|uniref:Profilin n=1 Tax=Escallonia rubra TaxID=112253 RepID=A0AA88RHV2_9ASTE|nr:hypothetical protein RJ640_006355 [Escallonia rubra]